MNGDDFSRSELGVIVTGIIGVALACWRAFFTTRRGLRTDRVEEVEATAREDLIFALQTTIKSQDDRITTLTARVDLMAQARNEAQIAAAKLETQVVHLTSTIHDLNRELARMQGLLDLANETIRSLQAGLAAG